MIKRSLRWIAAWAYGDWYNFHMGEADRFERRARAHKNRAVESLTEPLRLYPDICAENVFSLEDYRGGAVVSYFFDDGGDVA